MLIVTEKQERYEFSPSLGWFEPLRGFGRNNLALGRGETNKVEIIMTDTRKAANPATSYVIQAQKNSPKPCQRMICIDADEQLGYLAECATWRNSHLFGAQN